MFCKNCGRKLPDEAVFCSGCGTRIRLKNVWETPAQTDCAKADVIQTDPVQEVTLNDNTAVKTESSTNTFAMISLVCSILALWQGFTAIPAIIFGKMALKQIPADDEKNRKIAKFGVIAGYIETVLFVILLIYAISFFHRLR